MKPRLARHPPSQAGFTLAELLVYLMLSGIVMACVYQLLMGQSRAYGRQRELMDVHETLRTAAALLAWEIRQASATNGDLYSIGDHSITLRSTQGSGFICVGHPTQPRFGLWLTNGDFQATVDDSVLVFAAGGPGMADDVWKALKVTSAGPAAAMGLAACDWVGAGVPDVAVQIRVTSPSDTADIALGAPLRTFRRIEYGLFAADGRWWLGRRVGAGSWEKLTGPLLPVWLDGLVFSYKDAAGNPTANLAQVAVVDFVIRAQSYRAPGGGGSQFFTDTLATRVALRG